MTEGLPKCARLGLTSVPLRLGALGWMSTVRRHALLALLANARTILHTSANAMVGSLTAAAADGKILSMLVVQQPAMHVSAARKEQTFLETKTVLLGSQPGTVAAASMELGCG